MAHKFNPAHAERLIAPERKAYQDPEKTLSYLNLGRCSVLVDVGCGPGWFALEAARQMRQGGVVYGVDISEEMLAMLKERAEAQGLTNVKPVLAEEEDEFPVPTESADVVLVANVYHEVDPASMFLGELKRMLKPGGTCMVVDWKKEPTTMGPPVEERVDPQDVCEEFGAAGFELAETCDVGPYHYGLKFRKTAEAR